MFLRGIIILFFFNFYLGFSQNFIEPGQMKSSIIALDYGDYKVETQIIKKNKALTAEPDLSYYWYSPGKIIETKGGFEGRVLHGYYHSFYLNKQLKETGGFKLGLKQGEWKSWYPDGKLKEIVTWKDGRKNGAYLLYNDLGIKMAEGRFKNDRLDGKFYTFDGHGKILTEKVYKEGEEVIEQPGQKPGKKAKKEGKKIFHKKKETDNSNSKVA